ncbi:MAG: hypothetical protein M1814_000086 [Vezdaea aestivalis]|nr:MAG: hypothetical protein M1814_000086 [Vezdaea aestivalis]
MEEVPITENESIPPSIHRDALLSGITYSHYSPLPPLLTQDPTTPCVLGIDEAGRGPVLGPMVYGVFYIPASLEATLLSQTHHFDDSKVLTGAVRSQLMATLCRAETDLHSQCGWATTVISARDISSGMLKTGIAYNLNAQAMDTTIELIKGVLDRGVNVREVYIDTIGPPAVYQAKLLRIFPTLSITVAKKADSLYPCVSAASVAAKVTRDVALEVCYSELSDGGAAESSSSKGWGSGYPSDAKCSGWLRANMDPVFGWGNECRFSWGTAKSMLEPDTGAVVDVSWWNGVEDGGLEGLFGRAKVESEYLGIGMDSLGGPGSWYGQAVGKNEM